MMKFHNEEECQSDDPVMSDGQTEWTLPTLIVPDS